VIENFENTLFNSKVQHREEREEVKNHRSSGELVKSVFGFFIIGMVLICQPGWGQAEDIPTQGELTNKGMAAYQAGKPVECLEYLKQAVELYPDEQAAHLNYASLAYQIALEFKRQDAEEETWKLLGLIALEEFSNVIIIGKDSTDESIRTITGHAAFLMGDMWHYLYDDLEQALDFFEFAKEYSPDSELLKREMEIVRKEVGEDYVPKPLNIHSYQLKTDDNSINK
jgi:tetratricopeptide (TPR) repeat protein